MSSVSVTIASPVDAVWKALTKTNERQPFYFDSMIEGELKPGAKYRYCTRDGKTTFIEGETVEFVPPTRWSHTFRFVDIPEPPGKVTFTLKPEGTSTVVTVDHELEGRPKHEKRTARGWPFILGNLKQYVETGKISFGARFQNGMMNLVVPLMPKPKPYP